MCQEKLNKKTMWYKFALTEIDPTGQIVFEGMKSGKFDFDNLKFDVSKEDGHYVIKAFVPGSKDAIGQLNFYYSEKTNNITITYIEIYDIYFNYPDIFTMSDEDYARLGENETEEYLMRNTGRGISIKLYEKMKDVIQDDPILSNAKYIIGNNNSIQAVRAKNRVFGEPEIAGKGYATSYLIEEMSELQNNKKILEQSKVDASEQEQLAINAQLNKINTDITALQEKINESLIDVNSVFDRMRPSKDGKLGSQLGGEAVDFFYRIPRKTFKKTTVPIRTNNPHQQRLNM